MTPLLEPDEPTDGRIGSAGAFGSPSTPGGDQERQEQLASMDAPTLRLVVATMPEIEQAKGVLMGCYGIDSMAAFRILNRVSSKRNLKVRSLAVAIVEAASTQGHLTTPREQVQRVLDGERPI